MGGSKPSEESGDRQVYATPLKRERILTPFQTDIPSSSGAILERVLERVCYKKLSHLRDS